MRGGGASATLGRLAAAASRATCVLCSAGLLLLTRAAWGRAGVGAAEAGGVREGGGVVAAGEVKAAGGVKAVGGAKAALEQVGV